MASRSEIESTILTVATTLAQMRASLERCERLLLENLERLARMDNAVSHSVSE